MTSTANLPHPLPEQASFSGRATSVVIWRGLVPLQLNAEGISKAKIQVIEHLATKNLATVILLQETRVTNPDVLNIPGYSLAAHTSSRIHGVATFVECSTNWRDIASSTPEEEVEWVTTEVEGVTITNVYKPRGTRLCLDSIPRYQYPCIYAGDFNCHSTTWGYSSTNTDGTTLEHWASNADVTLLYDPKQPRSIRSARWGTSANPDLGFANLGTCASRRVLERFPKSQHRPRLSSRRRPSTRCQRVLSKDGTFGRQTGRSSLTDSTLQATISPAQRLNRTQPTKLGAPQSFQLRRRPSRVGAGRA